MATEAEQLARIESLTRKMLAAAEADEWEQTFSLESERRPLLEAFFSRLPENRRKLIQPRLDQLLQSDRCVMELGKAHREAVGSALNQLTRGRNAVRAYESQT